MNKDNYKKAFSGVRPSEKTVERIIEMSEKKNKRIKFKGLLVAVACLAALLCGTLTANAATDGALFEGMQLIINGEDVNLASYIKNYNSYVKEDGTKVEEYEIEVPDSEDGSASIEIHAETPSDAASDDYSSALIAEDNEVRYEIKTGE